MFIAKSLRWIIACLTILALIAPGAQAQRKKQIAVLDFDFATVDIGLAHRAYGGQENLARRVSDKLVTSLVGLGTCQVIERSQLEKVLREQNLGMEGRIDPSTAAKVGRILGVDALIIGSVSVFDLQGLPKDSSDTIWDPRDMQARIAVNFRVVDTTTAVVELSNEMMGTSANARKKRSAGEKIGTSVLKGILSGNRSSYPEVKDEDVRDVVQLAVDDVVGKIALEVDNYLSGARRHSEADVAPANQINGRVIEVNGPTVYIMDINRSAVRIGDRLFVRRGRARRDPVTGREVRFTEKIGEVEVVEIQDEVVVGSFSGSGQAQVGDIITNSVSGAGSTSPIRQRAPSSSPSDNPTTRSFNSGKQERSFTIDAHQGWLDTRIEVQPNMQFEFTTEGTINIDRATRTNAAGYANRSRSSRLPLPSAPVGALIARIRYRNGSNSNIVLVGVKGSARAEPGEYGSLLLGINDDNLADNSGFFTVRVRW